MLHWRLLHTTVLSLSSLTCVAWAAEPPLCPSEASQANRIPGSQSSTAGTQAAGGNNTGQPGDKSKLSVKESKPGIGQGDITIDAQHSEVGVDGSGTLRGNVVVKQGDREIHGEQLDYNSKQGSVKSDSGIEYQDPVVRVTGQGGTYSTREGADVHTATFDLRQRAARGAADTVQVTPQGVIDLTGVKFTTCPVTEEAWAIHAKRVTLDTQTQIGDARSARVELEGVPIMYLPWVSFPLGNERKSGFLFPTFGVSSRSGAELYVPYYFNIAPNADFTFQPIVYSRRGADVGGDTRFLTSNDHGELTWNYLPYDEVFHSERNRIKLTNVMELPDNFRFSVNAETVSDTNYFVDFGQGPEGTSTAFVPQEAKLTYRDDHWKIDGLVQHYQTTDYTLLEDQRPYAKLPQLATTAAFGVGPAEELRYGFESEIVNFNRSIDFNRPLVCQPVFSATGSIVAADPCVNGWRIDVMPQMSLNFAAPGYFVRPGIAWRATQYKLTDTGPGEDRSPSRTLPIATFDTGLMFDRTAGSHDQRTVTLEPRLLYLYVPYRSQNELPLFDTATPDLDPVDLFRNNRFVGTDRVGDANQISVGVTSRLLDTQSGKQFLTATVGQAYYFTNPRVLLPNEVARTDDRSDFVAQIALTAFQHWSADLGLQWNPQASQSERSQINIQYKPANDAVINVGYRYQRDLLQQAEVSSAWPVSQAWNVFVRGIYSFMDGKPLERFAGFEYRSCCWKVRLGGRSFVSTRTGAESTGVYLQLELSGLASVGSASDSFLMDSIRGYAPTPSASLRSKPQ